jgi:DNA-binding XRE family transcriptional regulator
MTGFRNWDDVKHELFDTDELTTIEQGAARRLTGIRLGEIRQSLGLTQATVAERMGVRQERVSVIERGDPTLTKVSTLAAYAEALGGHFNVTVEVNDQHLKIT